MSEVALDILTDFRLSQELNAISGIDVKLFTPDTVKLEILLRMILVFSAVNAARLNAVGATPIACPDIKVTVTFLSSIPSVIITVPFSLVIVTVGWS